MIICCFVSSNLRGIFGYVLWCSVVRCYMFATTPYLVVFICYDVVHSYISWLTQLMKLRRNASYAPPEGNHNASAQTKSAVLCSRCYRNCVLDSYLSFVCVFF